MSFVQPIVLPPIIFLKRNGNNFFHHSFPALFIFQKYSTQYFFISILTVFGFFQIISKIFLPMRWLRKIYLTSSCLLWSLWMWYLKKEEKKKERKSIIIKYYHHFSIHFFFFFFRVFLNVSAWIVYLPTHDFPPIIVGNCRWAFVPPSFHIPLSPIEFWCLKFVYGSFTQFLF
jgi:hypothetical protein